MLNLATIFPKRSDISACTGLRRERGVERRFASPNSIVSRDLNTEATVDRSCRGRMFLPQSLC